MQEVFRNAVYHAEPTVLNRRLLPLCLGHCYILMAAESPFAVDTKPTLFDLAFAAGICSRSFEDGEAWIKSPKLADECVAWGKTCRKLTFSKESDAFRAYIRTFSAMPARFLPKSAKPCLHPWPLFVAAHLIGCVHIPEARAWNMPLPMAISLSSAFAETQGDKSLESEQDRQMIEELKAKAAKEKQVTE